MQSADSGGILGALLGREGNHVLVNGRVRPTLTVRDGALQRWRIVNAAKSRYFELVLGDGQPFELIGVDGGHMEYSLETLDDRPRPRRAGRCARRAEARRAKASR